MHSRLIKQLPTEVAEELRKLGDTLRKARLERGLRQADIAARLGISRMTVRSAERGEARVHWGIVVAFMVAVELNATSNLP